MFAPVLVLFIGNFLTPSLCSEVASPDNSTGNKDMYVIHAMVYQVGILTNSTEEDGINATHVGNEEALTFYHTNGSNIDLSKIPAPLLTNVTGQSFVGLAPGPVPGAGGQATWMTSPSKISSTKMTRSASMPDDDTDSSESTEDASSNIWPFRALVKRNANDNLVKILNGTSIIPQEASVQSVGIPALLSLNNNLSEIPVPIPNTSVVQYAKINTLIRPANSSAH